MKKVDKDKARPVIKVVELIEKVIGKRRLDSAYHQDEVEKIFSYLIQGKDVTNAYERRDAGISDEEWDLAKVELVKFLKLEPNKNDKIFDF